MTNYDLTFREHEMMSNIVTERAKNTGSILSRIPSTGCHIFWIFATMATARKLSDRDVNAVFRCIHENLPLPDSLRFWIVPVASDGMKLSPPPFEFEGERPRPLSFSFQGDIVSPI
jgi:hypothetical protein